MLQAKKVNQKKAIQEDALIWLSKIEQGLSSPEKQSLVAWLNKDKQHYKMLSDISHNHPILKQLSGLFPLEQSKTSNEHSKTIFSISFIFIFCIAAISIMNALSFIDLPFLQPSSTYKKEYSTTLGQTKSFKLKDGSVLFLNTNSVVTVQFSKNYRRLTLNKGEAQFNVAKDKSRPFTVFVGDNSFTALGTIFNIEKTDNNQSELVVTEGTVLVAKSDEFLANAERAAAAITTLEVPEIVKGTILTSGQKIAVSQQQYSLIEKVELDQIQKDLAWQQGMLIFDGEPLSEVLTEVARYHQQHFEITEQELKHLKVAGYFKTGEVSALLTSLNYNFDISHKIIGDTIYLTSNGTAY